MNLFIAGIPYNSSAKDVNEFLNLTPEECAVRIAKDNATNKSKGYCFVEVRNIENGNKILQKDGKLFKGRSIRVKINDKERKGGYRNRKRRQLTKTISIPILTGENSVLFGNQFDNDNFHCLPFICKQNSSERTIRMEKNFIFFRIKIEKEKVVVNNPLFSDNLYLHLLESIRNLNLNTNEIEKSIEIKFSIFNLEECRVIKKQGLLFLALKTFSCPYVYLRKDDMIYQLFLSYSKTSRERITDVTNSQQMGNFLSYFFQFNERYLIDVENILERMSKYNKINEFFGYHSPQFHQFTPNTKIFNQFIQWFSPENGYYLCCCIQLQAFSKDHLSAEVLNRLLNLGDTYDDAELYIRQFFSDIFYGNFFLNYDLEGKELLMQGIADWRNDRRAYKKYRTSFANGDFPIKAIYITPLAIYLYPPIPDKGNRVIRKYKENVKNFARVHFVDENGYDLIYHTEEIGKRMKAILKNGIKCGKYNFQFLAFSNAQLRTQSLWMFSEPKPKNEKKITCNTIRSWMGSFSHIKNVAKYSARLGQCFSSTINTRTIQKEDFQEIDDITSEDGKYIFTDGCGLISDTFAADMFKFLPSIKKKKNKPIAFQLRFAGYKGMVVAYNFNSLGILSNKKLLLRKSMRKFESTHFNFEVIRTSSFRPLYLNRQTISLLETRGIKDQVFLDHQNRNIDIYNKMMQNKGIAMNCLDKYSIEDNKIARILKDLIKNNWNLEEIFIKESLKSISRFKKREVKIKTKIFIEDGAILLGVCDETRSLKYGQVFVRIQKKDKDVPFTVTGKIAVAKNPCFHPGDCRTLEAIEVAELNHLTNVIVFPTLGERDHPNECSGSDLDGDTYTVIWQKDLIPETKNFDPMDYTPAKAKTVENVTVEDISNFFVDSMKNNNLERISNAHLAHYAFSEKKLLNEKCLKLAELQSIAVDFPKTGYPAEFTDDLKPNKYPLFMEKEEKKSEKANCVIEKLYLEASKEDHFDDEEGKKVEEKKIVVDNTLLFPGYEEYLDKAKEMFIEYSKEFNKFLRQFKIHSEFDALSRFFIKYVKELKNRKHGLKKTNEAFQKLIDRYRTMFNRVLTKSGKKEKQIEGLKLASAMYFVTYTHKVPENRRKRWRGRRKRWKKPLRVLSFPYVVAHKYLIITKKFYSMA